MLFVGALTVTVKLHVLVWPQESEAVAVTVVTPIGKVLPLGGFALTNVGGQGLLAVTEKYTVAPFEFVAVVTIFEEQLIVRVGAALAEGKIESRRNQITSRMDVFMGTEQPKGVGGPKR